MAGKITNEELEAELRKNGWTDEQMKDPEQVNSGAVGLAKVSALFGLAKERGLR